MQTDLSPIAKSLIKLLARRGALTRNEIRSELSDRDEHLVDQHIDMLVRARVVSKLTTRTLLDRGSRECFCLYGTEGAAALTAVTDADVGGIEDSAATPHPFVDPSGVECIQITRHRNHNIGSAIHHLWNVGLCHGSSRAACEQIDDLKKARFHIDDEIELLQLYIEQRGAA